MTGSRKLVLASQSPRRREILQNAGIPFVVRVANIPEEHQPNESPKDYVLRLARSKAEAVPHSDDEIVLGADTVVVIDGKILEKPKNAADAVRMLTLLSGRVHEVITGVALIPLGVSEVAKTQVRFAPLSSEEIESYVGTGEPMDKAGAYAIQGLGSKFIEGIDGCYFNVVGLPVSLVARHLKWSLSSAPAASR